MRIAAAILRDPRGRTMLVRDPGAHDDVLFSRMWQFPAVEVARDPAGELAAHLRKPRSKSTAPRSQLEAAARRPPRRHISQHHAAAISRACRAASQTPPHACPPARRLAQLPVSSATRKIAAACRATLRPVEPLALSRRARLPADCASASIVNHGFRRATRPCRRPSRRCSDISKSRSICWSRRACWPSSPPASSI